MAKNFGETLFMVDDFCVGLQSAKKFAEIS